VAISRLETEIIAERVTAGQAVAKKKGKQWRDKARPETHL
tara:strand:- start:1104 stop:1223 length:120 start_codon:yes stop_codon:yes gene_type:complete